MLHSYVTDMAARDANHTNTDKALWMKIWDNKVGADLWPLRCGSVRLSGLCGVDLCGFSLQAGAPRRVLCHTLQQGASSDTSRRTFHPFRFCTGWHISFQHSFLYFPLSHPPSGHWARKPNRWVKQVSWAELTYFNFVARDEEVSSM